MFYFRLFWLSSHAQHIHYSETESVNIGEQINEVIRLATELEGITVRVSALTHIPQVVLKECSSLYVKLYKIF